MGENLEAGAETAVPVEGEQSGDDARAEEVPERSSTEATGDVLDRLEARLAEAQRLLSRQAELTERLHAENQNLRSGELRNAQMPLVRDLVRLFDDLERMRAVAAESAGDLTVVQEGLLDILARNGIEAFEPEPGESFDPRVHSAAGVEPTDDERLDKTVSEVVRPGFRWSSGEVIRIVEVRAYRASGPN